MDFPELSPSNELLLEHAAWVRKLAQELVRDPGAADDLAQVTWLAFLRAKPDSERPLRPWLARVMRNAASLRARRSSSRAAREEEVARAEQVPSTHELVERAEQQRKLASSVLALEDPYRTALLLRYYEGLTPSQMARALELPPATVRTHLHRGLAQLRRRLDEDNEGDRRAWVLMLQPLLQRTEPILGVGVVTLAAAAVFAIIATVVGFLFFGGESDRPSLDGPTYASSEAVDRLLATGGTESAREPSTSDEPTIKASTQRSVRLQDSAGRPLAAFAVRVQDHELVSDERGALSISNDARFLLPVDDARLALEVQVSHSERARRAVQRTLLSLPEMGSGDTLEVPSGPTYQIEFGGTLGVELKQLEARLVNAEAQAAGQIVQLAPVRPAQDGFAISWVRFADVPQGAQDLDQGWRLELHDAHGLWQGSAAVDSVQLAEPPVISMLLEHTAAIAGHLGGVAQERLADVMVLLLEKDEGGKIVSWTAPDKSGEYELRWVPEGEYVLRVASPIHALWSREVELRAGERSTHHATLQAMSSAGTIRGVVTSESGNYDGQLLVFLLDAQGVPVETFPTDWQRSGEGALEAAFEFKVTPPGELHLDVVSLADAVTFRAEQANLEAPFENARVTLLDKLPTADWSFEVRDDATGEELEEFLVQVNIDGGASRSYLHQLSENEEGQPIHRWTLHAGNLRWNKFEGVAPMRSLAKSAQISWTVRSDGYEDQQGDAEDFDIPGPGRRHVSVRMRAE